MSRLRAKPVTPEILRHWREAVPNDRLAHLVKDAARGLSDLLNRVHYARERVVLTRRGKPVAAIVPLTYLLLLEASVSLAATVPSAETPR